MLREVVTDGAIIIVPMPNGGALISVRTVSDDEAEVSGAVEQITNDCIDDTYGTHERMREKDAVEENQRQVKEDAVEKIEIEAKSVKVRRFERRWFDKKE